MTPAEYIALVKIAGPYVGTLALCVGVGVAVYFKKSGGNGKNGGPTRPEYADDKAAHKKQLDRVENQLMADIEEARKECRDERNELRSEIKDLRSEVQDINEVVASMKAKVDLLIGGKVK